MVEIVGLFLMQGNQVQNTIQINASKKICSSLEIILFNRKTQRDGRWLRKVCFFWTTTCLWDKPDVKFFYILYDN